ncbi:MAG: DUF2971 domain-containing protein [Terracidiphilus sp.]|jgi:hypothetical protein
MEILTGPVEDFLYQQIPPEVWHYTTLTGLQGILSSGTIWATEARSTNDETEFVHTRDIALEYLKTSERPDKHFEFALTEAYKVIESVFNKGALSVNETEVFIASFSAAEDLKSQWSDYADRHCGVSIGFDLRYIRPPKGSGIGVTFAPCVYEQADKKSLIRSALSHFVQQSAKNHSQVTDKNWVATQMKDWAMVQRIYGIPDFDRAAFQRNLDDKIGTEILSSGVRTAFDLLRLASHCKNRLFSEEKEWRLALNRSKGRTGVSEQVQYRGPNGTIPYICSNLFQPIGRLPITRIMLGPLCNIRNEVEKLVSDSGYAVHVIGSNIPLRYPA